MATENARPGKHPSVHDRALQIIVQGRDFSGVALTAAC